MSDTKQYADKELITGCVQNERIWQERLYKKYFASMMRMCMRYTNDREQAMEIINNGFLRVFKKIDTFSFKGSLEGWIRKLVYHSLSDYFKKHSKYLHFMVFEERDSRIKDSALNSMYFEDLLKIVNKLPPATKRVFKLYAIEGFTHREISMKVNISIGTSKWHLATARKILQQLIGKNDRRQYAG